MIKIILCMIVKNESRIMERCLTNALPLIDAISICDTGSTDNTVEVIENFCKEKNVKGCVWNDPWKNFGHNRSRSFKFCVETAKQLKYDLDKTYALLLDADMNLVVKPTFQKQRLFADGYLLIQKNTVLTYYNTRLVKLSKPWSCMGVTHEYWGCDKAVNAKLDDLFIDDINDGGCKNDKYERDIRLLTEGIKDEPNNERYYFYLAQSYMDAGKIKESMEWYQKRIDKGGWEEEVFYSMLRIGHGYLKLGDVEKGIFWYLKAHNYRPTRSEAIYEAANKYRQLEQYQIAYLLAKEGQKVPYPKNDLLFIRHDVYEYLFDFEISVAAFYVGEDKMKEGYECCKRLLANKNVPEHIRRLTESNIRFYEDKLKIKKEENEKDTKKEETKVTFSEDTKKEDEPVSRLILGNNGNNGNKKKKKNKKKKH